MRYETTQHQDRADQADQPRGAAAPGFAIESEGDQKIERGVWDLAASGVSLCEGGRESREGVARSRSEGSGAGEFAEEHEQACSAIEDETERKHQRHRGRVVGSLSETTWCVRNRKGAQNFSMSLIV